MFQNFSSRGEEFLRRIRGRNGEEQDMSDSFFKTRYLQPDPLPSIQQATTRRIAENIQNSEEGDAGDIVQNMDDKSVSTVPDV
jgi:hypothetical protein